MKHKNIKDNSHFFCAALMLLCLVILGFGQNKKTLLTEKAVDEKKSQQKRSVEIVNLINQTFSVPPEIAANVLMRVSKSKRITDPKWKLEILEEAFRRAENAQHPVQLKANAFNGGSVDTKSNYEAYAFEQKLDALSLKSLIVKEVLKINQRRANELLALIPTKLELKPLACEDTIIYEISDFYETVGETAEKSFTIKEIKEGRRANFLAPYVGSITSPAQLKPVLELLLKIKFTGFEQMLLENALTGALKKLSGDNRSFFHAVDRDRLSRLIYTFSNKFDSKEIIGAYRFFITNNLQAGRCSDNVFADKEIPYFIKDLNYFLDTNPLTADDIKQTEILGAPKIHNFWETNDAKQIQASFRTLKRGKRPDDEELKNNPAVENDVPQFLSELENWSAPNEEAEEDVFHQKCVLYGVLLDMVEKTTLQEMVTKSYLQYLSKTDRQKENVIEWNFYLKYVTTKNPNLFATIASNLSNPTISLYAELIKQQIE